MEKLIELLLEYDSGLYAMLRIKQNINGTNILEIFDSLNFLQIFIKWLIDKDKIDFEKIEEQTKCKKIVGGEEFADFDIERDFTPYEEVLMWVAIQDKPIEFLISILK